MTLAAALPEGPARIANRRSLELVTEADLVWIDELLSRLGALSGVSWRDAAQQLAAMPTTRPPRHRAAVIDALRYLLVPEREALRGVHVRQALLGAPALDPSARTARIDQVATSIGTSPEHLMRILWTDLAKQRLVDLARSITPREVAAEANVRLIQRVVGRSYELHLRIRDDATPLVRAAAVRGLLASTATVTSSPAGARSVPPPIVRRNGVALPPPPAPDVPHDPITELTISGPLAVFHRTTVYGRTLCTLVRELSACRRFVLDARCDLGYGPTVFRVETPVILPPPPSEGRVTPTERRLEKDLARDAPAWAVERTATGYVLRRDAHTWYLEIVGYWTVEYLRTKLAAWAGNVILCVDAGRSLSQEELPADPRIVRFEGRVPIRDVLAVLGG